MVVLLVVHVPAHADFVALAVPGGVASGYVVVPSAGELAQVEDLDDGTAGGWVGGGCVDVRVRSMRYDQKIGRMRCNLERACQVRAAVHHASDHSGASPHSRSGGIVWPGKGLRHGTRVQSFPVGAQSNAVVQAVQRDQHLGGRNASISTHDMI